MIKFNKYRYRCISLYREIRNYPLLPQEIISSHVRRFDDTMKQYNKKKNVRNASIDLAYRLSAEFFEKEKLTKKDLIKFLMKIGRCHALDFHGYELFFSFLILHAFDKLYHQENTQAVIELLRHLEVMDPDAFMTFACADEQALMTDEDYINMTRESKQIYRENIVNLAKKEGKTPSEFIEKALKQAKKSGKHIGFYLKNNKINMKKWIYFILLWGSTVIMSIQLYLVSKNLWLSLLALPPAYMSSKIFANQFISSFLKPHKFVRLRSDCSTVQQAKICVAIYAVLNNNYDSLLQKLEMTYKQNRNVNAVFGLLLDLPDGNKKFETGEKERIAFVQAKIDALNRKYHHSFFVCLRKRTFSYTQEQYVCAGHKSGALDALIRSMSSFNKHIILRGASIKKSDYLLLLDAHTETQEGNILELLSAACHPINRPIYDVGKSKITQGYGILIPKVIYKHSVLSSKMHNLFNQLLYGQDSFDGIGLIHIDSYKQIKHGDRYDYVKGAHLRCGYLPDIVFIRHQPQNIASSLDYEYERIKDDLQLLSCVKQDRLTKINLYILFEKLMDMLTPVISLALILLAALFEKDNFIFYGIAACMPYFAPTYKRLIHQILTGHASSDPLIAHDNNSDIIVKSLRQSLWKYFFIPYRALNTIKAIKQCRSHPNEGSAAEKQDMFRWYPFLVGLGVNMILGIYFLIKMQWQSIIFFVWATVPAATFILYHIKDNKLLFRQGRMYPND